MLETPLTFGEPSEMIGGSRLARARRSYSDGIVAHALAGRRGLKSDLPEMLCRRHEWPGPVDPIEFVHVQFALARLVAHVRLLLKEGDPGMDATAMQQRP